MLGGNNSRGSCFVSTGVISGLLSVILLFTYIHSMPSLSAKKLQLFDQTDLAARDLDCPRFAFIGINGAAGLGHKVSDVYFGMLFARENRAIFVLDAARFNLNGTHGSYSWAVSYFGWSILPTIDAVRSTYSNLTRVTVRNWDEAYIYRDHCHVILESCDQCCADMTAVPMLFETGWCFGRRTHVYNGFRLEARHLFFRYGNSASSPSVFRDSWSHNALVVAWHVRDGDLILNYGHDYFSIVYNQLALVMHGLSFNIFFFSENLLSPQFDFLHTFNASFVSHLDVQSTLHHFVHADVLITSGSSFPSVAAVYSTGAIVLQAFPKESRVGTYELPGEGFIARNGTIIHPSFSALSNRIHNYEKLQRGKRLGIEN